MYSFILFLLTLTQLAVIGGSYLAQANELFYLAAVYGSPFYSAMTLFRSDSAFFSNNPIYIVMFFYHIVKYGVFYLAQRNEGYNGALITAIIFEALYLCTSAYYLN